MKSIQRKLWCRYWFILWCSTACNKWKMITFFSQTRNQESNILYPQKNVYIRIKIVFTCLRLMISFSRASLSSGDLTGVSLDFESWERKYQMLNKKKMLTKFSIDKSEIRFGLFHWLLYLVWNSWNLNISFSHFLSQSFNLSSEFTYGCILKQKIENYWFFLIKYTFKFRNNDL